MDKIAVISVLAIFIESIVNMFFDDAVKNKWKVYVSLALGVAVTAIWQVGVLAALGLPMPNIVARYFDYIASGFILSRGSNYLHVAVMALKSAYNPPAVTTIVETVQTGEEPTKTVSTSAPAEIDDYTKLKTN